MRIRQYYEHAKKTVLALHGLGKRIDDLQHAVGRIELRQIESKNSMDIQSNEVKITSQWGEDGIIQFLLRHIDIENMIFVEFGVGDYSESNTRFLLKDANWKGLLIDGSKANMRKIMADDCHWQHDLTIDCSFITKDNINDIISRNGISGDIGILSVDIDGNDYWVWEQISCVNPRIVICEYNSLFGAEHALSTPYSPDFYMFNAHYSGLYWGASISGFDHLAKQKGYTLVGSNSVGNNIFFVRNDVLGPLKAMTPAEAHVPAKFRISRDENGRLSYLDADAGSALIAHLPLVDVAHGTTAAAGTFLRPGTSRA